jgi:hypothetical protein
MNTVAIALEEGENVYIFADRGLITLMIGKDETECLIKMISLTGRDFNRIYTDNMHCILEGVRVGNYENNKEVTVAIDEGATIIAPNKMNKVIEEFPMRERGIEPERWDISKGFFYWECNILSTPFKPALQK